MTEIETSLSLVSAGCPGWPERSRSVMDPAELVQRFPRLYHATDSQAWEGISAHGLLSTSALLDLFDVPESDRLAIESARRPECVLIEHPEVGRAVIRDNKPMSDEQLGRCLVGMSPADYYRLLNARVFLWPTKARLENHLSARSYRGAPQLVITIDTAILVERHLARLKLSPINSGATVRRPPSRGAHTFVPVANYDFEARRKQRGVAQALAEVTVEHGVFDLADSIVAVERRPPDGMPRPVVRR